MTFQYNRKTKSCSNKKKMFTQARTLKTVSVGLNSAQTGEIIQPIRQDKKELKKCFHL